MKNRTTHILLILIFLLTLTESYGSGKKRLLNLKGQWKFSIGDDKTRAEPNFDDSAWDNIFVPSSWEDEGYPGYDGYAWYRKSFEYDEDFENRDLTLILGFIDDVDEVYLNGIKIGTTGSFPPIYFTSYNSERMYHIPQYLLKKDSENVIAVRVYDDRLQGGMLRGNFGIYTGVTELLPVINLCGRWLFKIAENNDDWGETDWEEITVPLRWDYQGYKHFNGFAWYKKDVVIPKELAGKQLILLAGKIDDYDQTFFNDKEIGSTGNIHNIPDDIRHSSQWDKQRVYYIPSDLIKYDKVNTIKIKVYDGYLHGGIYAGQVGIITLEKYKKLKKTTQRRKKSFWERLFN